MKKYIITMCVVLGSVCTVACNKTDDKQYVLDYQIVPPYTRADTWIAYDAFNERLFDKQTRIYKVNTDTKDGANSKSTVGAIWTQAIYWDMTINAYERAVAEKDAEKQAKYKALTDQMYQGAGDYYVKFDWHNQDSQKGWFIYDDIMWWTISFARAYGTFKTPAYLTLADESFCRVWHGSYKLKDRGSYDKVNGGMYWNWNPNNPADNSDKGKMSCINFPTVVAAMHLYNNIDPADAKYKTDDLTGFNGNPAYPRWHSRDNYLKNAKEIYDWGVNNLFDKRTGNVADSRHENSVSWSATMYNQATFIGASCMLYKLTKEQAYLDNANAAANYAMNVMSAPTYIFPFRTGEEQGIYTAIFAQYMKMLVYDCGQTQYLKWVQRTIDYGWSKRDERNLTGKDYTKAPGTTVSCYDASGIPALMVLFPADK